MPSWFTRSGAIAWTLGVFVGSAGSVLAQPNFRAATIDTRAYPESTLFFQGLSDDGLLVMQEYNGDRRGFIQNFVFEAATGINHRLDDVVGTEPVSNGLGRVGGARYRDLRDGLLRYSYPGGSFLFEPTGPIGSGQGITSDSTGISSLYNSHYFAEQNNSGTILLQRLSAAGQPSAIVDTLTVTNLRVGTRPSIDSINSSSRVAGYYQIDEVPHQLLPFVWEPDLQGASAGTYHSVEGLRQPANTLIQTLQSASGEQVVFQTFRGQSAIDRVETHLWTLAGGVQSLVNLNDLFGRDVVQVMDINSAGMMLGVASDIGFTHRETFLYSPEAGYRVFDASWIDAPADVDFSRFQPLQLNDLGQIAGEIGFEYVDPGGFTHTLSNAVLLTPIPEPATALVLGTGCIISQRRARAVGCLTRSKWPFKPIGRANRPSLK